MKIKYVSLGIILVLSIFLASCNTQQRLLHLTKMKLKPPKQEEVEAIKNLHNPLSIGGFCKKDWWGICRG